MERRLLAVKAEHSEELLREIFSVLQELGIPAEVGVAPPGEPGAVVFQIPANRVAEAMLGLASRGFRDARVYGEISGS